MDRSWRVIVRGQVSDEVLAGLPSGRMMHVSGHEAGGHRSSTLWVRAPDAVAAEEAVRAEIPEPAAIERVDPLPYWMSIGVPEGDVDELESALSRRRSRTGSIDSLITKEPSDGFAELMLEVEAETDQGAVRRGLEAYRELRATADLPPLEPPYFYLHPPWPGRQPQPRHLTLLERAQDLLTAHQYDMAVVVAQTALEVLVAQVIYERLEAREVGGLLTHITGSIRTYTLLDDKTRKLWDELTGDTITQVSAWQGYRTHVARRHAVVHQGIDVGEVDASGSLAVVRDMIDHIERLPM